MQGLKGYLEQRTEHACLILALHAGSGPMSPVPRDVAASLKLPRCLGQHITLLLFLFSVLFTSPFVIWVSLNSGGRESKDHSIYRRTICAARPSTKSLFQIPPPAPRHIRDDQRSKRSASWPTTTPLNTNRLKEVPLSTKTPLRGIGLCNVQETNFPYKWTSSTYFSTPANMAEVVSDEAVVQPLQLGSG
jgi:hypothetical protein